MPGEDETETDAPPSGTDETALDSPGARSRQSRQTVGRFVIERELGAGGMGIVLLAHDPTLDRQVAIKLLRDDRSPTSSARVRMLREAQAMARLRHPNVVTVYEAGVHDGQVYLVMELLAGGTLRERLRGEGVSTRDILRLFAEAGRGLAAAHRAGLVHRDFKPANVLVDETDHAKVTDFGLAVQDDSSEREEKPRSSEPELDALAHPLTHTGDVLGTPRYMAPEQHAGKDTDPRTDQFAFCVALYEALYGRHPFRDDSVDALRASMSDEAPRSPGNSGPAGVRVRDVVLRGLSKDPARRFPSMDALLAALEPRRSRARLFVLGGVVMAAAGAAIALWPARAEDATTAARRSARACDCELVEPLLPVGARITAIRAIGPERLGPPLSPAWQPTGQLAIPRGAYAIEYAVGDAIFDFAIISRGNPQTRSLALPAPEEVEGYAFVPGGEIALNPVDGFRSVVHLEPYLLARDELPALVTYAEAQKTALAQHARLPTAAEWEWAARLGTSRSLRGDAWEWTATAFAPYPYAADGRDDELAPRDHSEVRGGNNADAAARRSGAHSGRAELRLAKTPRALLALEDVTVGFENVPDPESHKLSPTMPPADRTRLDRFLVTWRQLENRPPLLVEGVQCPVLTALMAAGVPASVIDKQVRGDNATSTVRRHPDATFKRTSRSEIELCETETEILGQICFDGDALQASSDSILEAMASTMKANKELRQVEIQAFVADHDDPSARSQRRAELVRRRLVALGVAADRLVAHGYGVANADPDHGLFTATADVAPANCPTYERGDRIAFAILERSP